MMHQIVHIRAQGFFGPVPNHFAGGAIDEGAVALQIDPVNTLSRKFKEQLHLLRDLISFLL